MLTVDDLNVITGSENQADRKAALIDRLAQYAPEQLAPHRLAQLLAQLLHESQGFLYVAEIWGPTDAQKRYEGRADLGNSARGDGFRYRGRDLIQVTGRDNYRALTRWTRVEFGEGVPDFEDRPDLLTDPKWLGIGVIWYWLTRVPAKYVDQGDIEMVTRRVNGGLNGYADRLRWYDRSALVLLGYQCDDIPGFQEHMQLTVDGISGPKTRAALHIELRALHRDDQPAQEPPAEPVPARAHPIAALLSFIFNLFKRS